MVSDNIIELIGNTPLVKINKMTGKDDATILVKLEKFNAGGSIKDRIAKYMIEQAEKERKLTKDKIIIEPTSGNTGIGLALVAAVKGYKIKLVMSESVSIERRKILKALGAEIFLTSKKKGTDGAIDKVHEIVNKNKNKYFMPNQFANDYNPLAHYETTAKEIIDQTRGRIDIIIAAMGTTGTLMGVSKRIKEFNPNIKIIGIEPYPNHKLQGMKSLEESYVPKIYDEKRLDEKVKIKDEEAIRITRELALKEGILVGMSSGAIIAVALKKAKELDNKKVIVAILPDGGERYLTTTLFN